MSLTIDLCSACVVFCRFPLFATAHTCLVPSRCECVCIHINIISPDDDEKNDSPKNPKAAELITFVGGQERRVSNGGNGEQSAGTAADFGSGAPPVSP